MATSLQALISFASRIGSARSVDREEAPLASSFSSGLASNLAGPTSTSSFPSLWLGPLHVLRRGSQSGADELYSSTWMSEKIKLDKANVCSMPEILLRNVTTSFGTVVDETRYLYLRDAIEQLPMHYRKTGSPEATLRAQAIKALTTSHPIAFTLSMTKILTESTTKAVLKASIGDMRVVEIPLTFVVKIEALILGWRRVVISLTAPGVIRGSYKIWEPSKLQDVSLELDTLALYLVMRRQSIALLKTAHRASMVLVSKQRKRANTSKLITITENDETMSDKEQSKVNQLNLIRHTHRLSQPDACSPPTPCSVSPSRGGVQTFSQLTYHTRAA